MPEPEGELFVYNWTEYIGEDTIPSFEEKYGVKVTYDFFSNTDEAYAKLGNDGGGYDVVVPDLGRHPGVRREGRAPASSTSRCLPNIVNLGAEWADPGYDPGNAHSVPYMWWTTGVGYDTAKITDTLDQLARRSGTRAATSTSRCSTTARRSSRLALIQLGYSANTTDTAEIDEALALLQQQKPLVRVYSTDTIGDDELGRRLDRPDLGRGHVRDPGRRTRTSSTTSPRRAA